MKKIKFHNNKINILTDIKKNLIYNILDKNLKKS